jgi:hypothetical protein
MFIRIKDIQVDGVSHNIRLEVVGLNLHNVTKERCRFQLSLFSGFRLPEFVGYGFGGLCSNRGGEGVNWFRHNPRLDRQMLEK